MTDFASVCLLSYNRPEFVTQAIESAITQAQHPLEMIVHDDGSDAETVQELLNMRSRGLISTLILNSPGHNEGQGIALNRMFNMAKGDPIIKADHDLIFQPGWLKKVIATLDKNSDSDEAPLLGCLGLFKYHHEPVHHEEMHLRSWEGWDEVKDFVGSAMVIPRRAFERFGPFEERSTAFAEDHGFKMKVTEAAGWACGLLPNDVAINQGFGLGPSTVVVERDGELTAREIKEGTKVL